MASALLAQKTSFEPSKLAQEPASQPSDQPRRPIWLSLFGIGLVAAEGMWLAYWLRQSWLGEPDPADGYNVFYVLFSRNELAGLALVLAFTAVIGIWLALGAKARPRPRTLSLRPQTTVILLALAVFALAAAGYFVVFHEYALTADENMADFQARIFLTGNLRAVVPAFWQPFIQLVTPTYAHYFPELHSWNSTYLPVYAALRAVFMAADLEGLLNPVLAGISVLALAAVTRKVWPNDPWKPLIAAALLASSSQFLLMSMTAYAMPAHLALNLIWLWLYLDPKKRRFWLAPFVGVAALGLHQPFFHALFVTPFLARLLWERRWKATAYFALVYAVGIVGWLLWWRHFLPNFSTGGTAGAFAIHRYTWMIQSIYLLLLMGWLALPLPLLAVLGFARFRRLTPFLQDASISCLLTFGFYVFVRYDQAHGWGDRYFHGTLGCLILVALAGWDSLCLQIGKRSAATFMTVGIAASLLIQFPLRCFQAESFVYPYAHAAEEFHQTDADLVAFNPLEAWYGGDLLRNSPFLNKQPVVICLYGMSEEQARFLQKAFPRRRIFERRDLARLGLSTTRSLP